MPSFPDYARHYRTVFTDASEENIRTAYMYEEQKEREREEREREERVRQFELEKLRLAHPQGLFFMYDNGLEQNPSTLSCASLNDVIVCFGAQPIGTALVLFVFCEFRSFFLLHSFIASYVCGDG